MAAWTRTEPITTQKLEARLQKDLDNRDAHAEHAAWASSLASQRILQDALARFKQGPEKVIVELLPLARAERGAPREKDEESQPSESSAKPRSRASARLRGNS